MYPAIGKCVSSAKPTLVAPSNREYTHAIADPQPTSPNTSHIQPIIDVDSHDIDALDTKPVSNQPNTATNAAAAGIHNWLYFGARYQGKSQRRTNNIATSDRVPHSGHVATSSAKPRRL
ncbi:MAG: hypothetical protein ACPGYV_03720 [Phycisphaeraceae bacterium]